MKADLIRRLHDYASEWQKRAASNAIVLETIAFLSPISEATVDERITQAMVDAAYAAWLLDVKNDKLAMRRALRAALLLEVAVGGAS